MKYTQEICNKARLKIRYAKGDDYNGVAIECADLEALLDEIERLQSEVDLYANRSTEYRDKLAKADSLVSELKADAERLAENWTANFDGDLYCVHCNKDVSDTYTPKCDHSPDCPVELHRQLMARIEDRE